jgi:bacteriocin biosynthesis cyclodehydratase domain-containing protein
MTLAPSSVRQPVVLRPRPHHPILRRSGESLQFGVGPGGSVEVSGADAAMRELLLSWHGGQPVARFLALAAASGIEEPEARAVLHELRAAGALIDSTGHDRIVAARAAAHVLVTGEGPLLASVASVLAASGVGRLAISGEGVVLAEDVGSFTTSDRGRPRVAAAVEAVRRAAADVHCEPRSPRDRVDLVVLTDRLHPEERPTAPHLPVRLVDGLGVVGPLVLPGRSACLRCIDLHLAAGDPSWPTVAADMAARVGSPDPATAAATAAIAGAQVLAALDSVVGTGLAPPTLDGMLEVDPRSASIVRRPWPPHPHCACGAAVRIPSPGCRPVGAGQLPVEAAQRAPGVQTVENRRRE